MQFGTGNCPPGVLVDLDPPALFYVWDTGRVSGRRVRRLVAFAEEHAISGRHPSAMLRVLGGHRAGWVSAVRCAVRSPSPYGRHR